MQNKPFILASNDQLAVRKFYRRLWVCVVIVGILPIIVLIASLYLASKLSQSLPSLANLEMISPPLITRLYDKDSLLIHEFYTERRIWTPYNQIPPLLSKAVISIEDRRFFKHWGINLQAIPVALFPALIGQRVRGASTLTQQLAKNLFLTPQRSIGRKLKEMLLAIKIEQTYTKEEIIEFYMNQVYLGGGAYGFQSAAQTYFSKPMDSLGIAEYALLAGLLQRPEAYRPDRHPEKSLARRNIVLYAMYEEGFITKTQLTKAREQPLDVKIWAASNLKAPYYVESIRQILEKKWGEEFIYGKGMNVYTTLDDSIQIKSEAAIQNGLSEIQERMKYATARYFAIDRYLKIPMDTLMNHWDSLYSIFDSVYIKPDELRKEKNEKYKEKFPDSLRYRPAQAALIVIENETGAIRALVGGADFNKSKFNRALQALRSPGSAFKAFVYTAAIDNGATLLDSLNDQPITIPDPMDSTKIWRPKNYDGTFEGNTTLRRALYRSRNLPSIETAIKYGLKTVVSYARRFGLKHHIAAVPALGIGACEATLLEMTSAYTVFPNLGIRPEPYFINNISNKDHIIVTRHIPQHHETIRQETAYLMTSILRDVNIRGTGASIWASGFQHPSGGKTGTTNRETDAWYIGFTKDYTMGVWVGTDDHKPLGRGHTGTRDALPIWLEVMEFIHKDTPKKDFIKPKNVINIKLCQLGKDQSCEECRHIFTEYFITGTEPRELCDDVRILRTESSYSADVFSTRTQRLRSNTTEVKGEESPRIRHTF